MSLTAPNHEGHAAVAAQRSLIQAILGNTIFCAATETPDNHIVKMGMASAACGPILKMIFRNTVLSAAIEAPDYDIVVRH
jgi:hypothetical protein